MSNLRIIGISPDAAVKSPSRRDADLRRIEKFRLIPHVVAGLGFGMALSYCLIKQFYFYQAVVVVILCAPFIIPFLLYVPRRSLLGLLVLAIPFNPSFYIVRHAWAHFNMDLSIWASDLIVTSIYVYLLVASVLNAGQRKRLHASMWTSALPVLLWITAGALSILPAVDKGVAIIELVRMMRVLAIFVAIYHVVEGPKDIRVIIYCLLIAFAVQTSLIFVEYRLGHLPFRLPGGAREADIVGTILRLGGTMGHSSNFAKLAALVLPICLATAACARKKALQVCASILVVTGLIALGLTVSRVGIVTSMFGMAWVLLVILKSRRVNAAATTAALVFLTVGAVFGWLVAGDSIMSRMEDDEGSAALRPKMFAVAVNVIKAHPFLGVGLNNYTIVAPYHLGGQEGDVYVTEYPVHNIYLLQASEIGILGAAFFLWFLLRTVLHAFSHALKAVSVFDSAIAAAVGVGMLSSWLQGLVGWGFRESIVHTSYLAVLAGAFAACKYQAQKRSDDRFGEAW